MADTSIWFELSLLIPSFTRIDVSASGAKENSGLIPGIAKKT